MQLSFSRYLALFFFAASLSFNLHARSLPEFVDLVEENSPAVVNISTTQKVQGHNPWGNMEIPEHSPFNEFFKHFFGEGTVPPPQQDAKSLGSGFIISKDGYVMLQGWTKSSGINASDLARKVEDLGASTIIYTDITVDGTLTGPNFAGIDNFLENVHLSVIVAGGISSISDIKKLCALNRENLAGVILGKALYEGTIDLEEAIEVCSQKE